MLTDTKCKSAKPKDKPFKLSDAAGMYLQVMPSGAKYWRLKYRFEGKEKRLALGVYPDTSLSEARSKRDEAKKLLTNGVDPSLKKQDEKRISRLNGDNRFEMIAREWHANNKRLWTSRYSNHVITRLKSDVFPKLGKRPINSITPPQVLDVIRKIEERGANEIARRQLQCCGQIFRYAVATGRAEVDPTRDLKGVLARYPKGHYASIEPKDLPDFIRALEKNDARLYPQTLNAIKLLMLTFVRTSELINASWNEFDFEKATWIIPAERMKRRKEHLVPLSAQAIKILKRQYERTGKCKWVFPNISDSRKTMSNNTILGALKRMGYAGKMTGHGFRALAMSTIKEELGYRHEVVDRQLAHVPANRVDKAYDRALFLKERKKMMQEWADYLSVIAKAAS